MNLVLLEKYYRPKSITSQFVQGERIHFKSLHTKLQGQHKIIEVVLAVVQDCLMTISSVQNQSLRN